MENKKLLRKKKKKKNSFLVLLSLLLISFIAYARFLVRRDRLFFLSLNFEIFFFFLILIILNECGDYAFIFNHDN